MQKFLNLNEDMIVAMVITIKAIYKLTPPNFGTSMGFQPMASALALQCSTN